MSARAGAPVPWFPCVFVGIWHLAQPRSTTRGCSGLVPTGHRPGGHLTVARCPGSIVPPDALPRGGWRLPFVQALHSLLGNLPSRNAGPRQELGAGRRPLCPLTQPGCATGHLQPVHQGWLHILGQHVTSSKLLPPLLRARQQQQPLCQHVGPLCSLGHVPSSLGQAERKRENTRTDGFTSYQNQSEPFSCLHLQPLQMPEPAGQRGGAGAWGWGLLPAPSPASRERRRAGSAGDGNAVLTIWSLHLSA